MYMYFVDTHCTSPMISIGFGKKSVCNFRSPESESCVGECSESKKFRTVVFSARGRFRSAGRLAATHTQAVFVRAHVAHRIAAWLNPAVTTRAVLHCAVSYRVLSNKLCTRVTQQIVVQRRARPIELRNKKTHKQPLRHQQVSTYVNRTSSVDCKAVYERAYGQTQHLRQKTSSKKFQIVTCFQAAMAAPDLPKCV